MGVVRNFIDIVGITPENELPKKVLGQVVQTAEAEIILIEDNINIKSIYQIVIDVEIESHRVINSPMSRIIVVDSQKKIKILYYDDSDRVRALEVKRPYNFFIDVEDKKNEIDSINIHIVDAYFKLIDKKQLYCNIVYIINVIYHEYEKGKFRNNIEPNISVYSEEENYGSENEFHHYEEYIALANSHEIHEENISKSIELYNSVKEVSIKENIELIDIDSEYL
ncbi:hypothetical protein [Clostridium sp. DL1XJH146]